MIPIPGLRVEVDHRILQILVAVAIQSFHRAAMPSTHKQDKPWDTDDIDKWKVSEYRAQAKRISSLTSPHTD